MNINEEQNRAKLIKLRKRHLIVKQHYYKSFGIQYRQYMLASFFPMPQSMKFHLATTQL